MEGSMLLRNIDQSKILVVEDDSDLRATIVMILKMEFGPKAIIYEARDGLEAVWKIQNDEIDVLITDIRMPKKSGIDLVESILSKKEKNPETIIILSGNVDMESVKRIPPTKRVKYLVKPFKAEDLFFLISRSLKTAA